jgi:hypothetical protein
MPIIVPISTSLLRSTFLSNALRVQANTKTSDLVGRLKISESVIWQKLLDNDFCKQMKTAKAGDTKVASAFKTYMTVRILVHINFGIHNELLYLLARFLILRKAHVV